MHYRARASDGPVIKPLLFGVVFLLAYFYAGLPAPIIWARLGLLAVGGALFLTAFWNGLMHVVADISDASIEYRWRWYEPQIRLMEGAAKLDENQLRFVQEAGLITGSIKIQHAGVKWHLDSPWGPLTMDWVDEHLKICAKSWPIFPAIRRYREGSLEYKQEYAFNHWMALWGLAEDRPGQEYIWIKTYAEVRKEVYRRVFHEFEDEEAQLQEEDEN